MAVRSTFEQSVPPLSSLASFDEFLVHFGRHRLVPLSFFFSFSFVLDGLNSTVSICLLLIFHLLFFRSHGRAEGICSLSFFVRGLSSGGTEGLLRRPPVFAIDTFTNDGC